LKKLKTSTEAALLNSRWGVGCTLFYLPCHAKPWFSGESI